MTKSDVYRIFKFWGGSPSVLSSRKFFMANATEKDKKAITKLTEQQFKYLNWEKPLTNQINLDLNRDLL